MGAERSFAREAEKLTLDEGDTFEGEGILAITNALLESGVSYVGGYQGAPVSHLMAALEELQQRSTEPSPGSAAGQSAGMEVAE